MPKRDAARKTDPDYITRLGAMMDVMEFAFRCDLTRVVSFGFGNAFGPGPMPWIGIGDDYHALTHRMTDAGVPEQVAKCILWETQQIAAFVKRLKAMPEGDHNVLYNTAFFVSSDVGEGGAAQSRQYGVSGRRNAGGAIASGRHLAFTPEDPNARRLARAARPSIARGDRDSDSNRIPTLHLSLLQAAGVPATSFADSKHKRSPACSTFERRSDARRRLSLRRPAQRARLQPAAGELDEHGRMLMKMIAMITKSKRFLDDLVVSEEIAGRHQQAHPERPLPPG